jgi:hypothetical protein
MFTLCSFNSLAMLTVEMNLSSLVYYLQDLEMLLLIYILFEYGLYLSSSFIVFRISLFRYYKLGRRMSFSLTCLMAHALRAGRLRLARGLPT